MSAGRSSLKRGNFANKNNMVPEDLGNRKHFIAMPPDDVGNALDINDQEIIFDSLGNHHNDAITYAPLSGHMGDHHTIDYDYLKQLSIEFKKLLDKRLGLPFAFMMKPHCLPLDKEKSLVLVIENAIKSILDISLVEALVSLCHYQTKQHHFYVFFIDPKEDNIEKNKDLILALRQIVRLMMEKMALLNINILVVLQHSKLVVEEHLTKIGAIKSVD